MCPEKSEKIYKSSTKNLKLTKIFSAFQGQNSTSYGLIISLQSHKKRCIFKILNHVENI